jgi:hypothetical protein
MTSTKTRGTRDSDLYSLDKFIVKAHRSAAGTAWRWRTELLVLGGLLAVLAWLSGQVTIGWAAVVLAAAIGIAFAVPHSRRFIIGRFWCVLARHRFQRLCWEARLHTRAGRLTRNTRWSQLVTIDIIRRDTLAARHQVGSPLTRLSAVYAGVLDGQPGGGTPAASGLVPAQASGAPLPWPQQPAATGPANTAHGGPFAGPPPCPAWKEATS